jgi:hypothetical protein
MATKRHKWKLAHAMRGTGTAGLLHETVRETRCVMRELKWKTEDES